MGLRAVVLGSAAGGGVPQWNCGCPVCRLAWAGDSRVQPRTQSSIAVSVDGEKWLLLNASPDIRQQILSNPVLQPRNGSRHSPIAAVLLSSGDIDHIAGLLCLRERQAFLLFGTAEILGSLDENRVFEVMARDVVSRRAVRLDESFEPLPGLIVSLIAVPGKVSLWREDEPMRLGEETEATVGVAISAAGKRIAYIPGCAAPSPRLYETITGTDLLFFDGTLWEDDEMITTGVGSKTGRRMGHMPMSGPDGSMATLADIPCGKRIFIHINNTNRALVDGSAERAAIEEAGWIIAHDGMAFSL